MGRHSPRTEKSASVAPIPLTRQTVMQHGAGLPRSAAFLFSLIAKMTHGSLVVGLPDGRQFAFQADEKGCAAQVDIRDWRVARKVLFGGSLGFAEAYLDEHWDSPDVTAVLQLFCQNAHLFEEGLEAHPALRFVLQMQGFFRRNTRRQAKRNISAHYDLGNAFYRSWLDRGMTYSSALFANGAARLEDAQTEKFRALAKRIELRADQRLLEVGCGWGGFAEFAAGEVGCHVTGLTISRQQFDYARQRIFKAGLNEKVDIRFQDYREETGRYDRIVSIEMFEAVGETFWPVYFSKLHDCLKPGGLTGLQIITIQDRFFEIYRRSPDFIQRYIFPGGMLPTPEILYDLGRRVGLNLISEHVFAHDYARTLAEWRRRFHLAWPDIRKLGFDDRFKRTWDYYLHYSEAGFLSRNIDVRQLAFARP